ncbi:tRNA pseudouridine(55) synthase TruB [candidate division WWE3 bacterium]|uniref:tRNA pseudouridine(55) synthase n=1 Tax=candidate division WWE3 bacterium TaxID=2053526 RepID=A0A7X9DL27_UNCKA|nr:tRNA pseudouridine(55) synthase TruB [candidate division WWE3 bacterium]
MIINVYKPKNWTSFDIVAKVRNLAKTKKVGHSGTLDPLAEGVLIVLTEKDTKIQDTFRDLPKEYYFEFIAGVTTPSADLESLPKYVNAPNIEKIKELAPQLSGRFVGQIEQTAPIFSAKKVNGQRLYSVARSSDQETKEKTLSSLPKFTVTIYELNYKGCTEQSIVTDQGVVKLPVLAWHVKCSSGTYIRTLAEDLAVALQTKAVVSKLVRIAIGNHKIEDSVKIEDLRF